MSQQTTDVQPIEDQLSEDKANELKQELRKDPEVQRIKDTIDERQQTELLSFGQEPANEISQFSDKILGTMKNSSMEDSSKLLKQLSKVMEKFDKKDFEENKGLFNKVFGRGKKMIEKIFDKYQSLGGEIEKINVEISKYRDEMVDNTHNLEDMYERNYQFYLDLEKYITAGQLKQEELQQQIQQLEGKAGEGNQRASMELETLKNGAELLDQRVYDLQMAQMVAFQQAPQIRLLQRGNTKLVNKINSAFVTTIPIFKTSVIQAVAAKRQKLVADSMSELDRRTNEMLKRNAQNVSDQSRQIAELAGGPSIKIETIEESFNTIVQGMQDTKAIEDENTRIREEGRKRVLELQENFKKKHG
ncbi:hypothetical protein N781_06405 [Pontibacillus halophilus JSM 076056 = DSM 19796]|uniref:Toxic anion resistance protein n=1 Tax=Pontibacillus halophilus JSM 076056 = DSM 19796 TaxID=1385510 RepID=A0A0A5GHV3_9BACI|nr:toxic anion resistance protein [Pontibacillus halophilus]KGX90695.1 hypothetical protein N781_06405 [Pontibacillus halophilus JSM 076056 = DSM 19796]